MRKSFTSYFLVITIIFFNSCKTSINFKELVPVIESRMQVAADYAPAVKGKIPRSVDNGTTVLVNGRDWTQGFFPGELWNLYRLTGNEKWREHAEAYTETLERLKDTTATHDLGFLLNCSFGMGYELTANAKYKEVLVAGANTLIQRFNPKIGVIKSWDFGWDYPVIIDNMMNLELLFLATKVTGDSIYYNSAKKHADTTLKNHFRDDSSSYHVVDYDTITNQVTWKGTHQGFSDTSAWARGQAWGLYGFTMAYRETGDKTYLNQAKKIASFIMEHPNLPEDKIPFWDFDADTIPNAPRDASAAAIMSSALFELYGFTNNEQHVKMAMTMLETLSSEKYLTTSDTNNGFILKHSVGNMPKNSEIDVPLNYADYYYLEALVRYKEYLNKQEEQLTGIKKIDGYRGIWFTLGQPYEYGDKYSGGLGTYTAKHRPMAIYSEEVDKTFFVYGGTTEATKTHLLCMIGEYDHKTKKFSKPIVVYDKLGVDDPHDNPSIQIDDDGYIWIFVSGRNITRLGFKFKSKNTFTSKDGFEQISREEMTYPQPIYIKGKGFFHFFTKYSGLRELYYETSADGLTWSEDQKLAGIKEKGAELSGHYQVSAAKGDRIVTFLSRHPNGVVDKRTDLYYLETSDFGKTWTTANGEKIKLPLTNVEQARIMDYTALGKNVYLKDVNFDAAGNPVCLFLTSKTHEPGPPGGPRKFQIARWNNEKWEVHPITSTDHNYDMGSLYIIKDKWKVIVPTGIGPQENQTGGEIEIWESMDEGVSWKKTQTVTKNSRSNQSYVRRPDNANNGFLAFWADGNPTELDQSRLYFMDVDGNIQQMPYYMNE